MPPGPEAAWIAAFVYTAFAWWFAAGLGALFGGLTGLGSAAAGRLVNRGKEPPRVHLGDHTLD